MEARNRLVKISARTMSAGAVGASLLLVVILFVLLTLSGLPRTSHPSLVAAPRVITSPEESPDARDRNNALAKTTSSTWTNQSPDAQERNERLAK